MAAMSDRRLETVQFFIEECKFNINQKAYGNTALFYANLSNVEMIGYLLEHGADPA
jgi:Ankyrin repeats (3 copies)